MTNPIDPYVPDQFEMEEMGYKVMNQQPGVEEHKPFCCKSNFKTAYKSCCCGAKSTIGLIYEAWDWINNQYGGIDNMDGKQFEEAVNYLIESDALFELMREQRMEPCWNALAGCNSWIDKPPTTGPSEVTEVEGEK